MESTETALQVVPEQPLYVPLKFWFNKCPFQGQCEVMDPVMAAIEVGDVRRLGELLMPVGTKDLCLDSVGQAVVSPVLSATPWVFGLTPLMLACKSDQLEAAKILLAAGAGVHCRNHYGELPAHFAQSAAMLRLLPGVEKDLQSCTCTGQTPLHYAARDGLKEVVEWWLTCKDAMADVLLVRDKYGDTPHALALREGHVDIAAVLDSATA
jgi:hypothetical protein